MPAPLPTASGQGLGPQKGAFGARACSGALFTSFCAARPERPSKFATSFGSPKSQMLSSSSCSPKHRNFPSTGPGSDLNVSVSGKPQSPCRRPPRQRERTRLPPFPSCGGHGGFWVFVSALCFLSVALLLCKEPEGPWSLPANSMHWEDLRAEDGGGKRQSRLGLEIGVPCTVHSLMYSVTHLLMQFSSTSVHCSLSCLH